MKSRRSEDRLSVLAENDSRELKMPNDQAHRARRVRLLLFGVLAVLALTAAALITNNAFERSSIEKAVAEFTSAPETLDAPQPAIFCSDISPDLGSGLGDGTPYPVPSELAEVSLRGTRLAAYDGEVRTDGDPITTAVLDGLLLNPSLQWDGWRPPQG